MSWELLVVLVLTVSAVVLFVTEALRVDLVALLVMTVLLVTGIISPKEGLGGFSNEATVTVAAMFVISEAIRQTGMVRILGDHLSELFERSYRPAMSAMITGVGTLSTVLANTGVVAIFLPVMTNTARKADISPTKVLMPLSFASMFGGVCTLIGTSTTILVSSIVDAEGYEPIGMFEMAPLGLMFFAAGVVYMLTLGDWLMPDRGSEGELTESFEMAPFLTEIELQADSESVYQTVANAPICSDGEVDILEVFRDGSSLGHPDTELLLKPHDVLRIRGSAAAIQRFEADPAVLVRPHLKLSDTELEGVESALTEAVVAPNSRIDGKTLGEVNFAEQFSANVLAIRREGEIFHGNLLQEELQAGDVLLLQAPVDRVVQLQQDPAFLVVSEIGLPDYRREMMIPTVLIIAAVVFTVAIDVLPIVVASVAGAVLLVLLRVLNLKKAYEAIDWQVIFLLAGILSLGIALEETGGVSLIADFIINVVGEYGELASLAAFYTVTALLTSVMSNNATAILLTPVALEAAGTLDVDPRPLIMAIAFAASTSFITPIGYQTNTLVYSAGQYRFADFIKVGTPLTVLFGVIAVIFLPVFWPF
ncbi:MAG: SLC13 family permease [Persicimonas sp.]